jgi:S-adenosylmethionine:tRNA ribosyltransferase-isomerase
MTRVSSFDFELPPELIAQEPAPRGTSRLLVVDRHTKGWRESSISELPSLLSAGDLVVANNTRVFPARLLGRREPSGGAVECLLLEPAGGGEWWALVHPGQKLKPGARLAFRDDVRAPGVSIHGEVLEQRFYGRRRIRFEVTGADDVYAAAEAIGHVPLPPYIRRPDTGADRERYQTVFARAPGAVAAPTAGLHFDARMAERLRSHGIGWAEITLHVGYGTFQPVRADEVEEHRVEPERFDVPAEVARMVQDTRRAGHRVVAVGTTTTRALESAVDAAGVLEPRSGTTDLFIHPGHRFRVVDALLTNFHLPRSSLLMLVAAFAGQDLVMAAYHDAIKRRFRFYSYGDAMLIL